jgi:hypothetical protein
VEVAGSEAVVVDFEKHCLTSWVVDGLNQIALICVDQILCCQSFGPSDLAVVIACDLVGNVSWTTLTVCFAAMNEHCLVNRYGHVDG